MTAIENSFLIQDIFLNAVLELNLEALCWIITFSTEPFFLYPSKLILSWPLKSYLDPLELELAWPQGSNFRTKVPVQKPD